MTTYDAKDLRALLRLAYLVQTYRLTSPNLQVSPAAAAILAAADLAKSNISIRSTPEERRYLFAGIVTEDDSA